MQSRATRSIAAENDAQNDVQDNFSPLATKDPVVNQRHFLSAQLRSLGLMGRTQVQAVAAVFSDNELTTFDGYDRGGIFADHPPVRFKLKLLEACNNLIIRVRRLAIKQAADTMCSRRISMLAANSARAVNNPTSFNTTAARRVQANSNLTDER